MQLALDFRESPSRWRTAMLCFRAAEAADDQLIEVNALIEATERAGRNYEREPLPAHLEAAWPPAFLKAYQNRKERDEYQVLREGIRDLERLLEGCSCVQGDQTDPALINGAGLIRPCDCTPERN